jgi:NAD(P)-dependent dehydrogenase (short-subunit alcohol dehydrogenase family)
VTKPFEGKVALVTGASSGLGEATALKFAEAGAKVVIVARRVEKSAEVVERILELGSEAFFVQTDVTRAADAERMVRIALEKFGRLDCAVNNAGISGPRLTPMADFTEAQWDEVMGVNLKAVWLCMKYEIPALLANGGGAIVNVSSIYGSKPSDIGHGLYATSKHGVVGLTKSAAVDYGQMSIRINAVAPGFTQTEMVDLSKPGAAERYKMLTSHHCGMKRLGKPEETANAIVWLCSDGASYINGEVLAVDGGSQTRLY